MGTETCLMSSVYQYKTWGVIVKLNNPLMGTETCVPPKSHSNQYRNPVKLNNPLMGTETYGFTIWT